MEKIDIWRGMNITSRLHEITKLAISLHGDKLSEAVHSQLDKGVDGDGKRLPVPYSKPYAKKRRNAGLQIANKDLNFSGTLRSKAYIFGFENFFEIGYKSKLDTFYYEDEDETILDLVYGKEISKPNDANMRDFMEKYIKPLIWRNLLKI